jgi:hypothetical protein
MFDTIKAGIPSAQMAGIIGDSAHTYGYHRGRNYVSSSDYSVQLSQDKKGDGEAACALDISWSKASDQYTVSQRLLNAKNDSRCKKALREFYGSTDGNNVCGWDYQGGYAVTSDDSHLWHIHLSILRQYCNDTATLKAVADVICGHGTSPAPEDDMPQQQYIYSKSGQKTKLAKAGTWYCVNWDEALANTGGSSLVLPDAATLFSMSAWLYFASLPSDYNMYWRVQTLDRNGKELAKYPVAEIRGTTGATDVQFSMVGSVSKKTNLRILVSSTMDNTVIDSAWWRCFNW